MEGFQKVGGSRKYFKYNECTAGQVLIEDGVFLGTEEGRYGLQHIFREKTGVETCLNGAGQLDYLISKHFTTGDRAQIIYKGKVKLTKGAMAGKDAHNFEAFRSSGSTTAVKAADDFGAGSDISL